MSIELKTSGLKGFVEPFEIDAMAPMVTAAHNLLHMATGAGSDFLGWLDLPQNYDKEEFSAIWAAAQKIRSDSEALVVIGIGGSYLGARAAIEFLHSSFYNNKKKETPDIYFAGNNISSAYLNEIIGLIGERDFSINIISKSGTTTEPAIAFRIFKELLEKKYGKEGAKGRIYATTDKARGALKSLCDAEGYQTFVIPDDIGGRYSVLTPVGLLPIAVSGADINALMAGAARARDEYGVDDLSKNACYRYAALRHILYNKGKTTEILVSYEPSFNSFSEWYKQLFAESHGKNNKGIFPVSAAFSTDLHSIGQYIQEGVRNLFETVLWVENSSFDIAVKEDDDNIDGLNFLSGATLQYVNSKAFMGTMLAHTDGGVPNIVLNLDCVSEYNLGYLIYFFEKACGLGGYLLGVNPFDQPGVEGYKNNMFALLGKPGYEDRRDELSARL